MAVKDEIEIVNQIRRATNQVDVHKMLNRLEDLLVEKSRKVAPKKRVVKKKPTAPSE